MVTIKLVSYLKAMAGFSLKEFKVDKPVPLRQLISFNLPDDRIVIIIDDTSGGTLDTEVSGDMRVLISPVFGGGKNSQNYWTNKEFI